MITNYARIDMIRLLLLMTVMPLFLVLSSILPNASATSSIDTTIPEIVSDVTSG